MIYLIILGWIATGGLGGLIAFKAARRGFDEQFNESYRKKDLRFCSWICICGPLGLIGAIIAYLLIVLEWA